MRIPLYWAEGRMQQRDRKRSVTVRRFGWSDESPQAAQAHADARTREAFERVLAGEPLPRQERRAAYLGSEGVPIREEIIQRHGEAIITRNRYGAWCLNVEDVLFADVDLETFVPGCLPMLWLLPIALLPILIGLATGHPGWGLLVAIAAVWISTAVHRRAALHRFHRDDGPKERARRRIAQFVRSQSDWRARLYRTPNGYRLIATHRRFAPDDPAVAAAFEALGVDTVYRELCRQQQCFRARLTAKPWRIGIHDKLKPAYAAWQPEHAQLSQRQAWIAEYERKAADHAACHYLETLGKGRDDADILPVIELHDRLCHAQQKQLPLA